MAGLTRRRRIRGLAPGEAPFPIPAGVMADGRVPLYRRIFDVLRDAIVAAPDAVGRRLPTEGVLATHFGVSLITVRHALHLLEAESLIRKQRARHAVILGVPPEAAIKREISSIEDILRDGEHRQSKVRSYRREPAPSACRTFGLPLDEPVHSLRLEQIWHGKAIGYSVIRFHPSAGSRLKRRDFDDVFVFRVLQRRLGIQVDTARVTIGAHLADEEAVDVLGCELGAAMVVVTFAFRDKAGQVVQVTTNHYLADAYTLSYEVHRVSEL